MNTLYRNNQKFTKDEAVMELLKDKGFTTEPPQPKNKYNPNGSLRVMPENGEAYWFIDSCGLILKNQWENDSFDRYYLYSQNCFDTEEAAQKALTMQLVAQPLIAKVWEMDKDWECDWEDYSQGKWALYYLHYKGFHISESAYAQSSEIFMSEQAANHLLSDTYTDKQRAAFMNGVKLWESFGGKIGDEEE